MRLTLTPVVTGAALFSGAATAVQSAAVTALYVLIVETIVHRELHVLRDVPRVMSECALLVGADLVLRRRTGCGRPAAGGQAEDEQGDECRASEHDTTIEQTVVSVKNGRKGGAAVLEHRFPVRDEHLLDGQLE